MCLCIHTHTYIYIYICTGVRHTCAYARIHVRGRLCSSSHTTAQEMVPLQVPIAQRNAAGKITGFVMETVHMLDPHSVVAYLVNIIGVQIPAHDVAAYWGHARAHGEAWVTNHPATSEHIPLGLYGDEARFSTTFSQDKVLGIFLNMPLWRPRSIRASRFLLFGIEEKKLYKHFTLDAVLRRIVWSINLLFDGMLPQVDHAGKHIRGASPGHICKDASRFALTELRGDQLFHKQIFRWKASWTWTSLKVCHKCQAASRGAHNLYYDWDNWTSSEFRSFEEWLAERMPNAHIRPWAALMDLILIILGQ